VGLLAQDGVQVVAEASCAEMKLLPRPDIVPRDQEAERAFCREATSQERLDLPVGFLANGLKLLGALLQDASRAVVADEPSADQLVDDDLCDGLGLFIGHLVALLGCIFKNVVQAVAQAGHATVEALPSRNTLTHNHEVERAV